MSEVQLRNSDLAKYQGGVQGLNFPRKMNRNYRQHTRFWNGFITTTKLRHL